MSTDEAFAQLDQWASQIVHGKNLFREVAETLRREIARQAKLIDDLENRILHGEEE